MSVTVHGVAVERRSATPSPDEWPEGTLLEQAGCWWLQDGVEWRPVRAGVARALISRTPYERMWVVNGGN